MNLDQTPFLYSADRFSGRIVMLTVVNLLFCWYDSPLPTILFIVCTVNFYMTSIYLMKVDPV